MKKAYLYTNNHFSAKSVVNAAMIKQQLGEPIEGDYPIRNARALSELAVAVSRAPDVNPSVSELKASRTRD